MHEDSRVLKLSTETSGAGRDVRTLGGI